MNTLIEAKRIGVEYDGEYVLRGVSVGIEKGDFISILGPNGSGKTTLIRALLGLVGVREGTVRFLDRPVTDYRPRELARRVSFLPQNPPVTLPFLVRDIVMMGRFPYLGRFEIEREKDVAAAEHAMDIMGVKKLAGRHLTELSGGEVKRVFIAQAVAQESDILFLDEPTASLDISYQVGIFEMLETFNAKMGKTVVLVTHDINHAARYARRILLLKEGKVVHEGSAEEVVQGEELSRVFDIRITVERDRHGKPFVIA
ncbi:MAG: ABC transporter ATP-binding protein [Spirochaetes bacterium]|nr:ABC transporter ATP-binding protein [Spirochaetota bacterium]